MTFLFSRNMPALLLAIPVIFAPEIRRALERLGRAGTLTIVQASNHNADENLEQGIRAVVEAAARLSARQHGALIVIQRLDSLDQYIETGVQMRAHVTPELLLQIFYPDTPLHDGAVIIQNDRIAAAACFLPLTVKPRLSKELGTRHRAAIGVTEETDAVAIVVSEETGSIAFAHDGEIERFLDPDMLRQRLRDAFERKRTPVAQRVVHEPAENRLDG